MYHVPVPIPTKHCYYCSLLLVRYYRITVTWCTCNLHVIIQSSHDYMNVPSAFRNCFSIQKNVTFPVLLLSFPLHFLLSHPAPYDNITANTSGSMAFREASALSTSCSNLVPTAVKNLTSFLCIGDFFLNFFLLFLVMHIPTHM